MIINPICLLVFVIFHDGYLFWMISWRCRFILSFSNSKLRRLCKFEFGIYNFRPQSNIVNRIFVSDTWVNDAVIIPFSFLIINSQNSFGEFCAKKILPMFLDWFREFLAN